MRLSDLNEQIRVCGRCRLSQTRVHALCGEGDRRARLMLVAQAPGQKEDLEGAMFIGPSGRVLDDLLGPAGVRRSEIYMTNLVKCFLPRYRKPKADEIQACCRYLDEEIELVEPAVIAPLGYFAIRYVLEKYELPMPDKSGFDNIVGRLFLAGGKGIYPLRHPSALLHNRSLQPQMESTYRKLGVFLSECKWYPVCPMKFYHRAGRLDSEWIERYCRGDFESCVRFHMEESGVPHPDWMLPDGSEDEGLRD
ncbi:MAG: uracil-DNA glycosylase [Deltaproteobacteria bacterium]|nr:uracil-DNA glycosylase [Deltaproteobacteria bacterium]